jgi:hypothetical protein
VKRFSGLSELPTARTISRWLSKCTARVQDALLKLNADVVSETVKSLRLSRLTIDVDGTVLSTGQTVEWAKRGYNPHDRKSPSYYPITAHLAQTTQIVRVKNRPGNVHDGRASMHFLRDLSRQLEESVSPNALIEWRFDGAFFRDDVLSFIETRGEYAMKVPFWTWLGIKDLVKKQRHWTHVAAGLDAFEVTVHLDAWDRDVRLFIYRKRVAHVSPKNFQLNLFDPGDGCFEFSAITSNKRVSFRALWEFMCGRGTHEKTLSELKTGYAFDAIPTRKYAANSAWQILSVLAHNLVAALQIETGAVRRNLTAKRAPVAVLKRISTMRFELFSRAGLLQHPQGRATLTLSPDARRVFDPLEHVLA